MKSFLILTLLTTAAYSALIATTPDSEDEAPVEQYTETQAEHELYCLVQNIYHEARGESVEHQSAVAHVTLNRVASRHFPDTVCGVVWQSKQFSWTQDGKSDEMRDHDAIMTAVDVAIDAIRNREDDPTNGMRFYYAHNKIKTPSWAKKPIEVAVLGNHTFLRLER